MVGDSWFVDCFYLLKKNNTLRRICKMKVKIQIILASIFLCGFFDEMVHTWKNEWQKWLYAAA